MRTLFEHNLQARKAAQKKKNVSPFAGYQFIENITKEYNEAAAQLARLEKIIQYYDTAKWVSPASVNTYKTMAAVLSQYVVEMVSRLPIVGGNWISAIKDVCHVLYWDMSKSDDHVFKFQKTMSNGLVMGFSVKAETPGEFLNSFTDPDKIIQHCPENLESCSPEEVYGAMVEFGREIHKLRDELELNVLTR